MWKHVFFSNMHHTQSTENVRPTFDLRNFVYLAPFNPRRWSTNHQCLRLYERGEKIEWNATHFSRLWRVMGATYFHKNVTTGALILWQCEHTNNFSDGGILEPVSTVASISLGYRQYTPCSVWVCVVNVIRQVPKAFGHEFTKWNPITTGCTTAEELCERSYPSFVGCYVACSNPLFGRLARHQKVWNSFVPQHFHTRSWSVTSVENYACLPRKRHGFNSWLFLTCISWFWFIRV